MIDLYKDNHVPASIRKLFLKTTSQELLTGFLPNFTGTFLALSLETSLHRYRKIRPVERYRHLSASGL